MQPDAKSIKLEDGVARTERRPSATPRGAPARPAPGRPPPRRSGPASADHFAQKLCGFDPVRYVTFAWAGRVDGSTKVLPVGPACTALWVALCFSACFQV